MFFQKMWPQAVAAVLMAAAAAGQEPLTVDAYVGIVMKSHPLAARARSLADLNAADGRVARAWPDPAIGASRGRGTAIDGLVGSPEWNYSISQMVPWPGTRTAQSRAAELSGRGRLVGQDSARWNLELDARLFYWRLVSARRAVERAQKADEDAAAVLELTNRRADVGEVREADRSRARAERLAAELALSQASREAEAAERALRVLAGETLGPVLDLTSEPGVAMSAPEIERRRQTLMETSPVLRAARSQVELEEALVDVARAARAPDIDFSFTRVGEIDKRSWSLGAGLRLPLWNGGRAEVARAEASASFAKTVSMQARLETSLAFEDAVQRAATADDRLRFISTTLVPTTRRTWELVRLSYEEGETSLLDLLDAQRTLRSAEREQEEALFGATAAWIELERICGPNAAGEKR